MKLLYSPLIAVLMMGSVWLEKGDRAIAHATDFSRLSDRAIAQVHAPASARLDLKKLGQALDREDIADAIRQVELGWKKQYEDYYQGRLTSQYVDPDEMRRSLDRLDRITGEKPALIYAIPTANHLDLILVAPGKPLLHRRVAVSQETLLELSQRFRLDVVNAESLPKEYLPKSQQLYQWIIAPLEGELRAQKINTLIFCLGTGLRSLPMAALSDGRNFLVEKYNLAIIPAFNLLDRQPTATQGLRVLAMGASEFQSQSPLPAVPAELTAVTGKPWRGKSLLNQEFTVAKLRQERSQTFYGIVHLATHAEFLSSSAHDSYIQFWDQPLRLTQLRELGLQFPVVQLLVLSACRTALGNPQAELGFAGLAVQSGSKAAIASLWSVSDVGTYLLMTEFYRRLKTAPIKAKALQQAQVAMIRGQVSIDRTLAMRAANQPPLPPEVTNLKRGNLSHPYYWAAFTLIGNPW